MPVNAAVFPGRHGSPLGALLALVPGICPDRPSMRMRPRRKTSGKSR